MAELEAAGRWGDASYAASVPREVRDPPVVQRDQPVVPRLALSSSIRSGGSASGGEPAGKSRSASSGGADGSRARPRSASTLKSSQLGISASGGAGRVVVGRCKLTLS